MEIEKLEIFQYLQSCEPISKLNNQLQREIALNIVIVYFKRDQIILHPGSKNKWLYLIRAGAVQRTEHNGAVAAQLSEKDFFGQASLKRKGVINREVKAIEDTLLYKIPKRLFFELLKSNSHFKYYFERNTKELQNIVQSSTFPKTPVSSFIKDSPLLIDHKMPVIECAKIMKKTGLTSLLVTQHNRVKGIITDRVFCSKIVAENLSHKTPVGLVMSDQLITIDQDSTASEALLLMTRNNIRHLPIKAEGEFVGTLTATDLIHRQSNNPIYLVNQVFKSTSIDQVENCAKEIPKMLCHLVKNSHNAKDIAYSISSIGRAINVQILKISEKKLGIPPIKYAWIIAGSLARNDQTGCTDQDNGIILSDAYDPELHSEYFVQLSQLVCDSLNRCGYVYCPGDVMATNIKWRQPLNNWKNYFKQWITVPKPKALMYASIFFDLRCIYGTSELLLELNKHVKNLIMNNSRFLNFMALNALKNTPPIGLFRSFVLEENGSKEKTLNLKKRGLTPITDLARVYALSCDLHVINTQERLRKSCQKQALSKEGLNDLNDVFEFLSFIRLTNQVNQIEKGLLANNNLSPGTLSSLERRHLKDSFELIKTYQSAMTNSYQSGILG